ncbi:predicted protein [Sclerotinia sclerotiorum 1980 UF-70]|uniref:Uncharacterized protein n=1 Tax=Sclerotinia sclerotiorum (strain ATCC 18683 / 1980 / Ss-1) TaxID=665079 RepID=A7EK93_SCLS1|nr:predicted protein [Sclerotinia sclerotiorum 1980 UF-70]EDO03259.1 predicted protein [Sclerotinia sclerotiorum 1980 UF-70]
MWRSELRYMSHWGSKSTPVVGGLQTYELPGSLRHCIHTEVQTKLLGILISTAVQSASGIEWN